MQPLLIKRFQALCRPMLLLAAAAGLPWGCVTPGRTPPPVVHSAAAVETTMAAPAQSTAGSLWQAGASLNDMFANVKARQVGDIVTVRIVESSSATNKATTSAGRESSVSGGIESFFNLEKKFPSTRDTFNPFGSVKANLSNDFDGSGETKRSGDLTAYVSARVTGITTNGNLIIAGFREVTVNNEQQIISLTGVVRPKDVTPDNVVLSTYVADARIAYSGAGIVNDKQRPGWLAQILDQAWPF